MINLNERGKMKDLYVCKNLMKKYKNGDEELFALNDISTTINQGEITVILGPSGGGKTTFLNVLSGLDHIDSGEINYQDLDLAKLSEKKLTEYRRHNIGFIFQSYNLISTLTVRENVELGAYLSKDGLDVDDVLNQVGLEVHKDKLIHQLSGGQQQRVAIARVLVKNPKVIFCDEPTGALDEENGRKVLDLLQKLHVKYNSTLIMVTHNPNIAKMAHNVIHFNSGKIVEVEHNTVLSNAFDIEWS